MVFRNCFIIFLMFCSPSVFAELFNIDNTTLQTLIEKKVPIIDIRTATEWQETGVIEGSHKLTFFDEEGNYNVAQWLATFTQIVPDKNQPFVLICRSGKRTRSIALMLLKEGYTDVYNVRYGIQNWIQEKLPVVPLLK